jgi:hypothetical protein
MASWRKQSEPSWRYDGNKEIAFPVSEKLVDVALSRLVFSLVGVQSGVAAFADQRRVVEDLSPLPNWSPGGSIADAPRTLIFLFHHLHGALCMQYAQVDGALALAEMRLQAPRRNETEPLYKHRDLIGGPSTLGGRYDWSWEFLLQMPERWPVLKRFFALPADLEVNVAAYSMLLVLNELALDAAKVTPTNMSNLNNVTLDVKPMFVLVSKDAISAAGRKVFASRTTVERVAERAGAKREAMRQLWPGWKKLIEKFYSGFDRWGFEDGVPFPDLVV